MPQILTMIQITRLTPTPAVICIVRLIKYLVFFLPLYGWPVCDIFFFITFTVSVIVNILASVKHLRTDQLRGIRDMGIRVIIQYIIRIIY